MNWKVEGGKWKVESDDARVTGFDFRKTLHSPLSTLHSRRGATLLEFLIYIGMIGLVLTTATMFAAEFVSTQAKTIALSEAVRNARFAQSRIEIEIREAADLNTGTSTFGANPGTLSLATSTPGTNPTIFTITSGVLTIKQGAGAAIALTSPKVVVSDFTVDNVSTSGKTKAIRIRLKVDSQNTNNLTEQTATTTVESTVRINAKDGFSN